MSDELLRSALGAVIETVRAHADLLTELDSAIGDGDHGYNMKRGCDAAAEKLDALSAEPLPRALQTFGMTLVSKIGGASGPLYGTLFMTAGKALGDGPYDAAALVAALDAGVEGVAARGKSTAGEKTMLDVLMPVAATLKDGVARGDDVPALCARARKAADEGLEATRAMTATKGRAAFLGDRSAGHLDPGAQSSNLIVHAVCNAMEES